MEQLILVVDDNPDHRTIAAALLNHAGYAVLQADSVAAAEHLLEGGLPDLLLLDIAMPSRSGLEWLRDLRSNPATAALRVAAFTSFPDVYHQQLQQLHVTDVIDKAYAPARFVEHVGRILRRAA